MWELKGISPTAFNVLSDVMGTMIEGLLVLVLTVVYPYIVWESVKRGHPIGIDRVLAPPSSLWNALAQFFKGGTRWLLTFVIVILAVATLSHTMADIFLDFVSVEVGSNNTMFLGPETGTIPTYQLLGDVLAEVNSVPATPVARLVEQARLIALGLSRFSMLSPDLVRVQSGSYLFGGHAEVHQSEIKYNSAVQPKPMTGNLQVQCSLPTM